MLTTLANSPCRFAAVTRASSSAGMRVPSGARRSNVWVASSTKKVRWPRLPANRAVVSQPRRAGARPIGEPFRSRVVPLGLVWETVDLPEIRIFLALSEELHFGRTAERLGLGQSRVSRSLRELEAKLGSQLVQRSSRRVELTEAGGELVVSLRPVAEQLDDALSQAAARADTLRGTLVVGVVSAPTGGPVFGEIVRRFGERHPDCRAVVRDVAIGEGIAPLRTGRVHVAAVRLPLEQEDVETGPVLSEEGRVLAVHRAHRLASRASVVLADLAGERVGRAPRGCRRRQPRRSCRRGHRAVTRSSATRTSPRRSSSCSPWWAAARSCIRRRRGSSRTSGTPTSCRVPVTGLPPSRTALAWVRGRVDARRAAFVAIADEVLGGQPGTSASPVIAPSTART